MHCGTASDLFLRENLDWLVRASNWSKFSATAALGVIHKGYFEKGLELLGPYLPGPEAGGTGSVFSEGGALFALGLVNAGKGKDVDGYLRDKLKNIQNEVVQHGAALGLGMAGMASGSEGARPLLLWAFSLMDHSQRRLRTSRRRSSTTRLSRARQLVSEWASSCSAVAGSGSRMRCCSMRTRPSTRRSSAGLRSVSHSCTTAVKRKRTASSRHYSVTRWVCHSTRNSLLIMLVGWPAAVRRCLHARARVRRHV